MPFHAIIRTVRTNLLLLFSAAVFAQDPAVLLKDPSVKAALDAARKNEPKTIEHQIQDVRNSSAFLPRNQRGLELKQLFLNLGLKDVRIDKAGNVIGTRPGLSARPNLVFSAHLDTVFPEETAVKVSREGRF